MRSRASPSLPFSCVRPSFYRPARFVANQRAVTVAQKAAAVATVTAFPAEGMLVAFYGEGETGERVCVSLSRCALLLGGKWWRCVALVLTNRERKPLALTGPFFFSFFLFLVCKMKFVLSLACPYLAGGGAAKGDDGVLPPYCDKSGDEMSLL